LIGIEYREFKKRLRQGGEEFPAEAFAKGGNSDEQFQLKRKLISSTLFYQILLIYLLSNITSFI